MLGRGSNVARSHCYKWMHDGLNYSSVIAKWLSPSLVLCESPSFNVVKSESVTVSISNDGFYLSDNAIKLKVIQKLQVLFVTRKQVSERGVMMLL